MIVDILITNNLRLQPISERDSALVMELMQRIYPPAYAHFWTDGGAWYLQRTYGVESLQKDLRSPDTAYYFILLDGEAVGVFYLRLAAICPDFPNESALKVQRLYLGVEAQGKGIAAQLMHYAEQLAQQNGQSLIWLESMEEKPQAMRFYHKMGYQTGTLLQLEFERLLPDMRGMYMLHKYL